MNCNYAQDFIYKGVAVLDTQTKKCRLRNAKDVARVILAKARGWDSRFDEVMGELEEKGFLPPFDGLKLGGHLLMDEFVENAVVVRPALRTIIEKRVFLLQIFTNFKKYYCVQCKNH